jgi:N6-adenosine-specific RNA methylase IME4
MTIVDPTREGLAIAAELHEIAQHLAGLLAERFDPWVHEHHDAWGALADPLNNEDALHERYRFVEVGDEFVRLEELLRAADVAMGGSGVVAA